MIDVTAILLAHNEGGVLVDRALKSLIRSVEYAAKSKVQVEILIVMDRPDWEISEYFEKISRTGMRKINVDCGDPGLSRNCGVQAADGRYVTFLDGDNLISEQWVYKAFKYLESTDQNVVAHPEYHIFFDQRNFILKQIGSNSASFQPVNLLMTNFWDTAAMSRKEIYLHNPFIETITQSGLGYEDWHFNCETIVNGIEHHVAPETVHFMRSKEKGSVCRDSIDSYRLLPPTRLLQPTIFKKFYEQTISQSALQDNSKQSILDIGRLKKLYQNLVKLVFPSLREKVPESSSLNEHNKISQNIPIEIFEEWQKMHEVEPLLRSDVDTNVVSHEYVDNTVYTSAYYSLCSAVTGNIDKFKLLICDSSNTDIGKVESNIDSFVGKYVDTILMIIDTNSTNNEWIGSVTIDREIVRLVKLNETQFNSHLSMLIAIFILNSKPVSVYLCNSKVATEMFERYGNTIKESISMELLENDCN